jgi:hypothetical protein
MERGILMDDTTLDISDVEAAHDEVWNLGTIEIWPRPRVGDRYVMTYWPRENIVQRILRKLRIMKPAQVVSVELAATAEGRNELAHQRPEGKCITQNSWPSSV